MARDKEPWRNMPQRPHPNSFGGARPAFPGGMNLAPRPEIVRDCYGRTLVEGDQVQLRPIIPPLYRVMAIRPVVDPRVPEGPQLMDVICVSEMLMRCPRGTPVNEIMRVITRAEGEAAGQLKVEKEEVPPPAPPSGEGQMTAPLLPPDGSPSATDEVPPPQEPTPPEGEPA